MVNDINTTISGPRRLKRQRDLKTSKAEKPAEKKSRPQKTADTSDVEKLLEVKPNPENSTMETVDVLAAVRALCVSRKLSAGTTDSAVGLVAALLRTYPTCPTEEQVHADMKAKGKSAKTIQNTIWAVRLWVVVGANQCYL